MRERIRYMRAIYSLTQKEIGNALGCAKQYITNIEKNRVNATDEKLEEILLTTVKLGEAKKHGNFDEIMQELINTRKEIIEKEK
ncbi:helix-turn-helix transcriptional regulator [Clostridium botulinum]|uniref:helix-turn-helix transcriptional regulator n=1 Tax=unclassified Clostridium TaxID=2614128 RepID=UPI0013C56596|nr:MULTISPECIES: helix-turn-helix transcriptional regulator [unclassified Clostridium]MBN1052640.1 XRE family transcriptional regulator [Clostridium botulinum]NFN77757.1 helix-turn-helix transcriptional regulator [Clostridium botulinum]NFO76778.1 helix-turn-helix transcriptional regulator [Clostridium botulinum]NFP03130.1 helix-turn-helix transcriptional regulator [Clostridium botulinum]NFS00837.1 helix-turn-helix transcriptional regulator [Clostridium botulinum]